jgi:hypothetical protein
MNLEETLRARTANDGVEIPHFARATVDQHE